MNWRFLVLLCACTPKNGGVDELPGADDTDGGDTDTEDTDDTGLALPTFLTCNQAPLPTDLGTVPWNQLGNELLTLTSPWHSAQDVLSADDRDATVVGKFTYGAISKDLQGESVSVWIDDCSGQYVHFGDVDTNSDGRIALDVSPSDFPGIGAFEVYLRVRGDGSSTRSTLRFAPAGTQLLVFDIDGTLTTSDAQLVQETLLQLLGGNYVPKARDGALDLVRLRALQGYGIVYLTGRPYWLTEISRDWLDDLAFPRGNVHLADQNSEVLPTNDSVGAYKDAYLGGLEDQGFVISGAYGNATTDIYAFNLHVSQGRVFVLGPHGGEDGTVDLGDDYLAHIPVAEAEADPVQPFRLP